MARPVEHERKRELQVILPLKKGPHTLHSVIYKSLQKRRLKLIHYFLLLRPNYQLEHCITKRKTNEYKICYVSGQNLVQQVYKFPFTGNGKDYENEFLKEKNILRSVPLCLLHRKLQVPYRKLCGFSTQTSK